MSGLAMSDRSPYAKSGLPEVLGWRECVDEKTRAKCWRRCSGPRIRAHIQPAGDGFEWCASRLGELPLRWFRCDSLEVAKRLADEFCERIPSIGPMEDLGPSEFYF